MRPLPLSPLRCLPMTKLIVGKYSVELECSRPAPDAWTKLYVHAHVKSGDDDSLFHPIRLRLIPRASRTPSDEILAMFPRCLKTDKDGATRISHACFQGTLENRGDETIGTFEIRPDDPTALSILIELCVSWRAVQDRALLLHSSGVVRDGRLFLFSGPSQSGKTTVATRLNNGGSPFCVEAACILVNSDGAVVAYPTPLSDFDGAAPTRAPMPLYGIVFIEQAETLCIEPLIGARRVVELLKNVRYFFDDAAGCPAILSTAAAIAQKAPCCKMRFEKNDSFWNALDTTLCNESIINGK